MQKGDVITWIPGRRRQVMGSRLAWIYWYSQNLDADERMVKYIVEQGRDVFGPALESVMMKVEERVGRRRR